MAARKLWYHSKILWLNAVAAGLVTLEANSNFLQAFLPVNFYALVAGALPIMNAILRVYTRQGIRLHRPKGRKKRMVADKAI